MVQRKILGPHIYQAGANKAEESARLDITHYNRLSRKDLDAIEKMSNEVIVQVHKTEKPSSTARMPTGNTDLIYIKVGLQKVTQYAC